MNNDELEKRQDHVAPPPQPRRKADNSDDLVADRAYGYDRSNRSAVNNLEFRLLHGEWPSEEYSYIHSMGWDPATGNIRISYVKGRVVLISGRNLRKIYDHLRRHRVDFLREQGKGSSDDFTAAEDEPVIYRIEIMDPR